MIRVILNAIESAFMATEKRKYFYYSGPVTFTVNGKEIGHESERLKKLTKSTCIVCFNRECKCRF